MVQQNRDKKSESVTVGYKRPKYYTEGNKNFSPVKPVLNPIDEKDAFMQQMKEKKIQMKNMTPEELEKLKIEEKRRILSYEMDMIIQVIGKTGF